MIVRPDPSKFASRLEFYKALSDWHFDPSIDETDNPNFRTICRFERDWSSDVEALLNAPRGTACIQNKSPEGYSEPGHFDYPVFGQYKPDHVYLHGIHRDHYTPAINRMIDMLGLDITFTNAHLQLPGQGYPWHLDEQVIARDLVRLVIHLTDWHFGHFWQFGNAMWHHWKAGDVAIFDAEKAPHCTGNMGYMPRVTLVVTGTKTEKTQAILDRGFHTVNLSDE